MKSKIGKIVVPLLVLILVAAGLIVASLYTPAFARPTVPGDQNAMIGNFTGPIGGTAQNDNIKASLDLAHTDLDTIVLDAGTYVFEMVEALLGSSTGDVFYVDSSASGTTGLSWATAVNDLEEAVALCTALAGDVILIAPGHAETMGGTAAIDLDKANVTVIGLGTGNLMPTFTFDTSTDTFVIGATGDGTKIMNLKFISSVTAVASAIVVEAGCTDFVIDGCVFENEATTVDEFIDAIVISGTASDRGIIRNCRFLGDVGANAGPKASINFVDCDYLQIIGNEFSGDIGDAHIFNETTASNYITIKDNRIMCGYMGADSTNLDVTPGISLVATTTGWIQDNFIVTNVATPDLAIVAADCYLSGNTYSEKQTSAFTAVDIGTKAGQTYAAVMTATSTDDNLFDVSGGAILITSFVGVVTTQIGGVGNTIAIILDADAGFIDSDFSTAVETNGDIAGTRYTFTNAAESVLVPVSDTAGNTSIMNAWFCGEGMIEQDASGATNGAIKWYMTYIPFEDGVIVTPQ